MSQVFSIEVKVRKANIKNIGKKSLRCDFIPAVIYNQKKHFSIEMNRNEFEKVFQKLEVNSVIDLKLAGKTMQVLFKDYQFSLRTRQIMHVDFYLIDAARELKIRVPLNFIGRSKGVVRGGVIQAFVNNILVACKLSDIPEKIDIDITHLDIGDHILLKEIKIPAGVIPLETANKNLISIISTKASAVSDEQEAEKTTQAVSL